MADDDRSNPATGSVNPPLREVMTEWFAISTDHGQPVVVGQADGRPIDGSAPWC